MTSNLEGEWQCRMSYLGLTGEPAVIVFGPNGTARVNGQPFSFALHAGNVLRLTDPNGSSDYAYELAGDRLVLRYADGSSFECVRIGAGAPAAAPGGGSEWQLQGSYCHWSGSSSAYSSSSYSRTQRLSFDGRGRWRYGAESSFSGSAGLAFGSGGQDSGSYRVEGDRIHYTTTGGQQGVAVVNMRQDDGRITEILVDGELYASALCD